jgi:hypothetical protein
MSAAEAAHAADMCCAVVTEFVDTTAIVGPAAMCEMCSGRAGSSMQFSRGGISDLSSM